MSTLYGGGGNDSYGGSSGNDLLYGNGGNDSLFGGTGSDTLSGGAGFDSLDGGVGNDILVGGQGSDTFYGGTGDDQIVGDGQWLDPSSYASGILGLPTTLTVVNNADGPIDLWHINTFGQQVFVKTLAAGATYSFSTLSSNNYFLEDTDGYYLDVIQGGFGQTFSYNPPLNDLIYGGAGNDVLLGQYGNDTIYGGDDNDTVHGGSGADSLDGGAGTDSLYGGDGNDSVYGGAGADYVDLGAGNDTFGSWSTEAGNDTVYGGAGIDIMFGGSGNDQIYGGDGDDWITGGDGNDTLYGDAGRDSFAITDDHQGDTIYGGETGDDYDKLTFGNFASTRGVTVTFSGTESGSYSFLGTAGQGVFSQIEEVDGTAYGDMIDASAATGSVRIYSGEGADSVVGGSGNDRLFFGSGDDTVYGGDGSDLIDDLDGANEIGDNLLYGGAGADTIWAGGGADTVYGGAGTDFIFGEDGNDQLYGDEGDDLIVGDAGNDTLSGGLGIDTLVGGAGEDVFALTAADSGDLISDFDLTMVGARTTDQLDVSELEAADGSPIKAWDVLVSNDGNGNARLSFPKGETITLQGVSPAQAPGAMQAMGVPCFVQGSRILTPEGEVPVEDLREGDLVLTAEGKALPILWHGSRFVSAARLAAAPHLRPIRLRPGPKGRALKLSPQHGVYLDVARAMVRAAHLGTFSRQAHVIRAARDVCYCHFLLPKHSLIIAEGWIVESLYPGPMALAGLTAADRMAIAGALGLPNVSVLPMDMTARYGPRAVPLLSRKAAERWLAEPHFVQDNGINQQKFYRCRADFN